MFRKVKKYWYLFTELVKRDFIKKYKRTVLGIGWSILSPILMLFVMKLVFTHFFGITIPYYTTYLLAGQTVFNFFADSTNEGMTSLLDNAAIYSKINVPKYLFLFSKNVSALINFSIILVLLFICAVLEGITLTWKVIFLIYPIICLITFNLGVGLILSALFIFFRDTKYLYSVFLQLLGYISAIFYTIDTFPPFGRNLFLLNPIYLYIRYFRKIVIEATIPTIQFHLLALAYAIIAYVLGYYMYKKNNYKFLYYI